MEGRAAPGRLFSAPLRKAGHAAALPREPSGGRKRQGSTTELQIKIHGETPVCVILWNIGKIALFT